MKRWKGRFKAAPQSKWGDSNQWACEAGKNTVRESIWAMSERDANYSSELVNAAPLPQTNQRLRKSPSFVSVVSEGSGSGFTRNRRKKMMTMMKEEGRRSVMMTMEEKVFSDEDVLLGD